MSLPIPKEFAVGGVYLPPMLVAALLGVILALFTVGVLKKHRLTKYFFYPPLVTLALMVIYTVLIGTFIIGV